ncbi:MAG: flagellar motor protein MotB [Peptococcaceae bacterium]|jgi:chemotaxis protein MotB|nr:flagellar motor protein MotB [Peptococcaceae bacterium]
MARKKKPEEPPPANEWLNTYADMVTLLLTFFVLLFAMSSVDVAKFDAMTQSFITAFNIGGSGMGFLAGNSPTAEGQDEEDAENAESEQISEAEASELMAYARETREMQQLLEQLNEFLNEDQLQDKVSVTLDERGLIIRFQDSILFTSGSADLLPQSYGVLDEVAAMLADITNHVRVEGHSDNVPMNTLRFPSNWELSTGRATNVVRYLVDHGLPSDRLSALGYAEFRPVVSNDTADGRAKNRRVDIVVIRDSLARQEPPAGVTDTAAADSAGGENSG